MSENVVVVAGSEVADAVGLSSLYGGNNTILQNPRYASQLTASDYGNYLPEFWEYCAGLARKVASLQPSPFHLGLASLGHPIITQNIGGMHRKAGSPHVIEVNGNIFSGRCLRCQRVAEFSAGDYENLPAGEVPPCGHCGKARVRPDITLPLERKRHKREAEKLLNEATAVVYVGVKPGEDADTVDQWYRRVPYSVLVSPAPWGSFTRHYGMDAQGWAREGFPVHE